MVEFRNKRFTTRLRRLKSRRENGDQLLLAIVVLLRRFTFKSAKRQFTLSDEYIYIPTRKFEKGQVKFCRRFMNGEQCFAFKIIQVISNTSTVLITDTIHSNPNCVPIYTYFRTWCQHLNKECFAACTNIENEKK
jgi:hypothetical protein